MLAAIVDDLAVIRQRIGGDQFHRPSERGYRLQARRHRNGQINSRRFHLAFQGHGIALADAADDEAGAADVKRGAGGWFHIFLQAPEFGKRICNCRAGR